MRAGGPRVVPRVMLSPVACGPKAGVLSSGRGRGRVLVRRPPSWDGVLADTPLPGVPGGVVLVSLPLGAGGPGGAFAPGRERVPVWPSCGIPWRAYPATRGVKRTTEECP